jgi:hypothetical protein
MKLTRSCKLLTALSLGGFLATTPSNAEWQWTIEPYLLATNIEGDVGVGRLVEGSIEVDTSDILETLELGGMLHIEGLHSNGWGFMADYAFMRLGDDLSGPFNGINELTLRQGVFEAMAVRRFAQSKGVIDVYGGIRWWDNKVNLVLDLPNNRPEFDVSEDWIDPVIGIRYFGPLSEKWTLSLQADIGGFGMGADFTYSAVAGVIYRFNDTFSLDIKYKGLKVDYEDGDSSTADYFKYDTLTHGFFLGLIIEL